MQFAPRAAPSTTPTPYVVPPTQSFDGNDGTWSTFKISVGTPGQGFRLLASTKGGEIYVVVPDGCFAEEGANCPKLRGAEPFNSATSPGFQTNASSTWLEIGQYSLDWEKNLNYTGQGLYGYDKVSLAWAEDKTAISLDGQVVAGIATTDYYMGYLGLGIQSSSFSSLSRPINSFLYQMWNQSKIPSLSYSYTAGAKYRLKSVFGNLVLGGYDSTRFKQNVNSFSFSFASDSSKLLTVGVQSIVAQNSLQGTFSLMSPGHFSIIDSTVPHLWLPKAVCDNFQTAFGLTYDPTTDLYLVNSTIHEKLLSLNPSITIKLANSLTEPGTNYTNIILPYAAFDLQTSYPIYPNATHYFPIRPAANDTQHALGRTLLQEVYLIVDYERSNFSIYQAAFPDPLPSAHIVTINSPSNFTSDTPQSKRTLTTGAIAGIVAGGVVLLIAVVAGAVALWRKRKTSKQEYELAKARTDKADNNNGAPSRDAQGGAQELNGTPLAELGYKTNDPPQAEPEPQELPTLFTNPQPARWREVQLFEMDASPALGQRASRALSQNGTRQYYDQ